MGRVGQGWPQPFLLPAVSFQSCDLRERSCRLRCQTAPGLRDPLPPVHTHDFLVCVRQWAWWQAGGAAWGVEVPTAGLCLAPGEASVAGALTRVCVSRLPRRATLLTWPGRLVCAQQEAVVTHSNGVIGGGFRKGLLRQDRYSSLDGGMVTCLVSDAGLSPQA